jgi:Flp pilus assembly protein TadD
LKLLSRPNRVFAALIVTMALFGVASYLKVPSLWGINHLQFLPSAWWYFYGAVFAVVILLGFAGRFDSQFDRLAAAVSDLIFERGVWPRLTLAAAAMVLFYLFRMQTHFLGDGYTILAIYSREAAPVPRWTEVGSMWLVGWVQSLVGGHSRHSTLVTFQILSIVSGGIVVYNCVDIVSKLCNGARMRLVGLVTLLFSGTILLYFGYVEYYFLLWAAGTTFFNLALRYFRDGKRFYTSLAAVALAIFLHLQALYLIGGVAYLAVYKLVDVERRFIWRPLYWLPTALVSTAGAAVIIWLYLTRIKFEIIFLPVFVGRPPALDYAALSPKHLLDIVNLTLLLLPGLGALLVTGVARAEESSLRATRMFLLWCFVGSFLFLLVIDPQLGMERDWDLMSFTVLPLILYLLSGAQEIGQHHSGRAVIAYTVVILLLTSSYLAANIRVDASEARYHSLLRYYATKERSGWSVFVNYYQEKGDSERASLIRNEMARMYPEYRRLAEAYGHLNKGDYREAYAIVDSLIEEYPYNPDYLQIYANCLGKLDRFSESESNFQRALAVRPNSPIVENEMAQMYLKWGRPDKALSVFHLAHTQAPELTFVSEGLGLAYFQLGRLDSAEQVADSLFQEDSHSPGGHLLKMVVALRQGDISNARRHFEEYKRYGTHRSDYRGIIEYYSPYFK